MHKIVTYGMDGTKPRTVDLHELTLPDGTLAYKYPRDSLYQELRLMHVAEIDVGMGQTDLLLRQHLAFRNADVDWQLWVEAGARPIPRKYVITSKAVTGAPQYTVRIKQWTPDAPVSADAFAFKPPADAKKVEPAALREIDEVPPGIIIGGRK